MMIIIPTKKELEDLFEDTFGKAICEKLDQIIKNDIKKNYLSIEETCEILDVSRRHLQYLRDSGQISYVKHGRKIYFKSEDLEKFFNDNYIDSEV